MRHFYRSFVRQSKLEAKSKNTPKKKNDTTKSDQRPKHKTEKENEDQEGLSNVVFVFIDNLCSRDILSPHIMSVSNESVEVQRGGGYNLHVSSLW